MASVLITDIAHAYSIAVSDLKKAGQFIEGKVLPVLQKLEAEAPTIEAVTALVSPSLANIERVGEALLGAAIKAIEDAATAAASGGLSVSLDAQLVADIKAIIPTVKAAANTAPVAAK